MTTHDYRRAGWHPGHSGENYVSKNSGNVVALRPKYNPSRAFDHLTATLLMKQNEEGGIHPRVLEALLVAANVLP